MMFLELISYLVVCMVTVKLKYNFVETPCKIIIVKHHIFISQFLFIVIINLRGVAVLQQNCILISF